MNVSTRRGSIHRDTLLSLSLIRGLGLLYFSGTLKVNNAVLVTDNKDQPDRLVPVMSVACQLFNIGIPDNIDRAVFVARPVKVSFGAQSH